MRDSEHVVQAYTFYPDNGQYSLDDVLAGANEVLDEIDLSDGRQSVNEEIGAWLAYYCYPAGRAHE